MHNWHKPLSPYDDEKKNMKTTFPWNTMRRKNTCKSQIAYRHYVCQHKESVSNAIVLKPLVCITK